MADSIKLTILGMSRGWYVLSVTCRVVPEAASFFLSSVGMVFPFFVALVERVVRDGCGARLRIPFPFERFIRVGVLDRRAMFASWHSACPGHLIPKPPSNCARMTTAT